MHSEYVIRWAPEAEALFNAVLGDLPAKAVPFVRQSAAAATVSETRLKHTSLVTVEGVLRGFKIGTPERFMNDVRAALAKRGHKL